MPLIAISATSRNTDGLERVRVNQAYVSAVEEAGLIPVVLPPFSDPTRLAAVIDVVDGVLLSGGEDIDPIHYGAEAHPATGRAHSARDATEIELARLARERRLPTLAICRGVQVLNVALGGTLLQDIPSLIPDAGSHDGDHARDARVHDVFVTEGSQLAEALGAAHLRVNSLHHQALDRVAPGLAVTARAPDGVIEGVEWTADDWWALGVQWHPEELTQTAEPWDRALFAAFAVRCGL